MPTNEAEPPQGPFEGSRCVAGPAGRWGRATIRRPNEDGTFKIEPDVKRMVLMPYWNGVTPAEISFDDARLWESVFPRISPGARALTAATFPDALAALGFTTVDAGQAQQFWDAGCRKMFGDAGGGPASHALDASSSYELFLHLGVSAKDCQEKLNPEKAQRYFKLYWNQTRMGGREPSELPRRVTLQDAYAAVGLAPAAVDGSRLAFLQPEQQQGVRLPAALAEFLSREGVADAVKDCHPNNPELVPFEGGDCKLRSGMRERKLQGDYAVVIMTPHQGAHEWAAIFDDGEEDARVYLRADTKGGEEWKLTAPGIGMFFWDLAQTGLAWYQDNRFKGGKPVKRSDIGLTLDS